MHLPTHLLAHEEDTYLEEYLDFQIAILILS